MYIYVCINWKFRIIDMEIIYEITIFFILCPFWHKYVTSLYFGGGTPALAANRIKEIVDALNDHFIITEGIGLELHPDNVNVETLQILKDAGVTKISIGVQSFCDKYQKQHKGESK